MSEYHIGQISFHDKRALNQVETLLKKEGITRDKNLDYIAGMFDQDYQLVATGSCFGNTLRCLAVDSAHQGEGLLNQVISHLIDIQYRRGNMHLFLYTKCDTVKFFGDLGFYEVTRVNNKVAFLENKRNGFQNYLEQLQNDTDKTGVVKGSVIMNANPFTLGHQYLLETAAAQCDLLHVFIVSEDASLVPYQVRKELVIKGSSHLKNIIYHDTGNYMISTATFPSYFLKDTDVVIESHAKLDIEIFIKIAKVLNINKRFVGEEPFSQVTGIYNQVMKQGLEEAGLECHIIPRKKHDGAAISASKARTMLHDGQLDLFKSIVPESTYHYFTSDEGKELISVIKKSTDIVHY